MNSRYSCVAIAVLTRQNVLRKTNLGTFELPRRPVRGPQPRCVGRPPSVVDGILAHANDVALAACGSCRLHIPSSPNAWRCPGRGGGNTTIWHEWECLYIFPQ